MTKSNAEFLDYLDTLYLSKLEWFDEEKDLTSDREKVAYVSCEYLLTGDYTGYGDVC